MDVTLHHPTLARTVCAPSSKSAVHRPMIAAAFANAPTRFTLTGAGEDIAATANVLRAIGVSVETSGDVMTITPPSTYVDNAVADCGESGSTLRFLAPVVAALGLTVTFIRRGRLPQRPMEPLKSELLRHGVTLTDNEDGSLTVRGKLTAGAYSIAANVSSQFITGLLLALSLLPGASTLTLTGEIESAPYINMTLETLATFGAAPIASQDGRVFDIPGYLAQPFHTPCEFIPEGDYSGAAFPLVAGAIGTHPVTVTGLLAKTAQGDAEILALLRAFGATVEVDAARNAVTVSPAPLHGISIDAKQIPDLVPVLTVLATAAQGVTKITGAARLRIKESDRIATTAAMLRALGGEVEECEDGLTVIGKGRLQGGEVDGAGDHRIVMSAAVASLLCNEAVTIHGANAVAKSYPNFFDTVISN